MRRMIDPSVSSRWSHDPIDRARRIKVFARLVVPSLRTIPWSHTVLGAVAAYAVVAARRADLWLTADDAVQVLRLSMFALSFGLVFLFGDEAEAALLHLPVRVLFRRAVKLSVVMAVVVGLWCGLVTFMASAPALANPTATYGADHLVLPDTEHEVIGLGAFGDADGPVSLPWGRLSVEAGAIAAMALAAGAWGTRVARAGRGGVVALAVLVAVTIVLLLAPARLELFASVAPKPLDPAFPTEEWSRWVAAHHRWALLGGVAIATWVWVSRDSWSRNVVNRFRHHDSAGGSVRPLLTDLDVRGDESRKAATPESTSDVRDRDPRRAVWGLWKREAWLLVRHPIMILGALLSCGVFARLDPGVLPEMARFSTYVGLGLAPLSAAAALVAYLNTSRGRRDAVEALYNTTPVSPDTRTTAHLLAALTMLPFAAVLISGWLAVLSAVGASGSPDAVELLTGPLVVTIAALISTAVATWAPVGVAGASVIALLGAWQFAGQELPGRAHWIALWRTNLSHASAELWARPGVAHALYLAGIAAAAAAVAHLRHTAKLARFLPLVVALAVVFAAASAQLSPVTENELDSIVLQFDEPERSWSCVAGATADYCLFPAYSEWIRPWERVVNSVIGPVPEQQRPRIGFEQIHPIMGFDAILDELSRDDPNRGGLERRLEGLFDPELDDRWPIRVSTHIPEGDVVKADLAVVVARRAVGLAVSPLGGGDDTTQTVAESQDRTLYGCTAEGQAREVVALWLAGQGEPAAAALIREQPRPGLLITPWSRDYIFWPEFGLYVAGFDAASQSAVVWSPTGVALARELLDLPQAGVTAAIQSNWDRWIQPSTPSSELAETLGVKMPTPTDLISAAGLNPDRFSQAIAEYPRMGLSTETLEAPCP